MDRAEKLKIITEKEKKCQFSLKYDHRWERINIEEFFVFRYAKPQTNCNQRK